MKKYTLTESEIVKIANLAVQENGESAVADEVSLMANLFELQTKYTDIYSYIRNGGWFAKAAQHMDNGKSSAAAKEKTKDVLVYGNRTLPAYVNEHDCFSDINSVTNDGKTFTKTDRSKYISNKTIIKNRYGSTYTFYKFPTAQSDPFGYTMAAYNKLKGSETMTQREKYIKQMQSWVGKNKNDGSYKVIIDTYNKGVSKAVKKWGTRNIKMDYDWAWCACTVSAAAMAAGLDDIVPIEISCYYMIEVAEKFGLWIENDAYIPTPGDLIIYDWEDDGKGDNTGVPNHIGMIEKCDGKTITVIEGNKNRAVGRRTLNVNGKYIRGFVVPKFTNGATNATTPTTQQKTDTSLKINSKGEVVKTMQKMLIACGYDCGSAGADGDFGKKTLAALRKFQAENGLAIDGIYGGKTKAKLEALYKEKTTFKSYKVQVIADALNIRKGPGTNYDVIGVITDKGTYTITEVSSNNWGKIKKGWISLKYTKKK